MQTAIANSDLAATQHVSGQTASTAGDFTWKGISPLALASSSLLLKPQVWLESFENGRPVQDVRDVQEISIENVSYKPKLA